jgi:hypothetical protein
MQMQHVSGKVADNKEVNDYVENCCAKQLNLPITEVLWCWKKMD